MAKNENKTNKKDTQQRQPEASREKSKKSKSNADGKGKVIKKKEKKDGSFRCDVCNSGTLELVYHYPTAAPVEGWKQVLSTLIPSKKSEETSEDVACQYRKCNVCGAETKRRPIRQDIIDKMLDAAERRKKAKEAAAKKGVAYGV